MFVVAPLLNQHDPATETFNTVYPVVFENTDEGHVHPPVAKPAARADAQKLSDALNKVLTDFAPKTAADNTKGTK